MDAFWGVGLCARGGGDAALQCGLGASAGRSLPAVGDNGSVATFGERGGMTFSERGAIFSAHVESLSERDVVFSENDVMFSERSATFSEHGALSTERGVLCL